MEQADVREASGRWGSLAAPSIFFLVLLLEFISRSAGCFFFKKGSSKSSIEVELKNEIKELVKKANFLSQPSTFVEAAKLQRLAAEKQKKLDEHHELHHKELQASYWQPQKIALIMKVVTYTFLVCWFWKAPVATISRPLVQPFGRMLSWGAGGSSNNIVKVGIMPWLILCSRVSRFMCRVKSNTSLASRLVS